MHTTEQLNTALDGRYVIERRIGAGGMAVVYLARDLRHNRHVALKVLNPELGAVLGSERFIDRKSTRLNSSHTDIYTLSLPDALPICMAVVYLARDLRHNRHVALKVLNPELGAVLGSERF